MYNIGNADDAEYYKDTIIYLKPDGDYVGSFSCDARFFLGFSGHRNKQVRERDLDYVHAAWPNAVWIHGGARYGFDNQVHEYILKHKIPHKVYRPDYITYPSHEAPLRRNDVIVDQCRILVACYDGRQKGGTFYTINRARAQNKFVCRLVAQDWPTSKANSSPF